MAQSQQKVTISRRDPWAAKKWYPVYLPSYLGGHQIAEVPANAPEKLINRTLEITLFDITKNISHIPVKLVFQIVRTDGTAAYTEFKRMELARDYVRALVRRGTSKVVSYTDVVTKDGWKLRVFVLGITAYRTNTSRKHAIAREFRNVIQSRVPNMSIGDLLNQIFSGDLNRELFAAAKKIYPMRKVEVMKIKVLQMAKPVYQQPTAVAAEEVARQQVQEKS